MPTIPPRAHFAAKALEYWLRQDYAGPLELVIVADPGSDLYKALPARLPHNRRLSWLTREYTGSYDCSHRTNQGHAKATGAYLLPWDDDDWHGPQRVSQAVSALHYAPSYDTHRPVTRAGLRRAYYWRLGDPELLVCDLGVGRRLKNPALTTAHYATCIFARSCVDRAPMDESLPGGADYAFQVDKARRQDLLLELADPSAYVVIRHGKNSWQTDKVGPAWAWSGLAPEQIMGPDAAWYRSLSE